MDAATLTVINEERKANKIERSHSKGWRVVRASVQGTSHAKTGQPCQDSSSLGEDAPEGIFVAAIADGAGSAELSADGSRIAACAATQRLVRLLKLHTLPLYEGVLKEILLEAVHFARKTLEAETVLQDKALREFASTLIVAICGPRINWQASLDITTRYGGVSRMTMFTYAIQSIALNASASNTPHAPFFAPLFRWTEKQEDENAAGRSLAAFLSSPRVRARADDDLTLLLAVLP